MPVHPADVDAITRIDAGVWVAQRATQTPRLTLFH
jgi:hypothetical protein